ncbi:Pih1p [Sugiyamaella lignohabitans]|uniref:Pih1p n=1 Tax=Sugiyamaella lignohabitans TaxID=796027 RepID=A0A161HH77_9ASCO|nr:Pih1p [Sugiyamaella lignohabitans]ANB15270.1 Pih1p [Sugiyamaella lignohabitans]
MVKKRVLLDPTPFFVLKSRIVSFSNELKAQLNLPEGCKVFINICTDPAVDVPKERWVDVKENIELPMLVSDPRTDVDKKGVESAVFDCCVNDRVGQEFAIYKDFRVYIIEASMAMVELQSGCSIDRENLATPKLKVKGIPQREYEVDVPQSLEDSEEEEEPNFISSIEQYAKNIVKSDKSVKRDSNKQEIDEAQLASAENIINEAFGSDNIQELQLPIQGSERSEIKNKPILIEEITTTTKQPHYTINPYNGPFKGPGSPPSYLIDIRVQGEEEAKSSELKLSTNKRKLVFGDLDIALVKPADKVEAFFTRDSGSLQVFIY